MKLLLLHLLSLMALAPAQDIQNSLRHGQASSPQLEANHGNGNNRANSDGRTQANGAITSDIVIIPAPTPTPPTLPTNAFPPASGRTDGVTAVNSNNSVARNLKAGKKKGKDSWSGSYGSDRTPNQYGLIESIKCIPFERVANTRARSAFTEADCRTNSCGNGCCREYHFLVCDESNQYQNFRCVCNERTTLNVPVVPVPNPGTAVPPGAPPPGPGVVVFPNFPPPPSPGVVVFPNFPPPPSPSVVVILPNTPQGPGPASFPTYDRFDSGKDRKNKKKKGKTKNKGSVAADRSGELIELHPCVEMEDWQGDLFDTRGDSVCQTNSCGGGCCRTYNWLICDRVNDHSTIPCICNENTYANNLNTGTVVTNNMNVVVPSGVSETRPTPPPLEGSECSRGSFFWNHPSFADFVPCNSSDQCGDSECCLSTMCLCGKPVTGTEKISCL